MRAGWCVHVVAGSSCCFGCCWDIGRQEQAGQHFTQPSRKIYIQLRIEHVACVRCAQNVHDLMIQRAQLRRVGAMPAGALANLPGRLYQQAQHLAGLPACPSPAALPPDAGQPCRQRGQVAGRRAVHISQAHRCHAAVHQLLAVPHRGSAQDVN